MSTIKKDQQTGIKSFLKNLLAGFSNDGRNTTWIMHETSNHLNSQTRLLPVFAYNHNRRFKIPGRQKVDLLLFPAYM